MRFKWLWSIFKGRPQEDYVESSIPREQIKREQEELGRTIKKLEVEAELRER